MRCYWVHISHYTTYDIYSDINADTHVCYRLNRYKSQLNINTYMYSYITPAQRFRFVRYLRTYTYVYWNVIGIYGEPILTIYVPSIQSLKFFLRGYGKDSAGYEHWVR